MPRSKILLAPELHSSPPTGQDQLSLPRRPSRLRAEQRSRPALPQIVLTIGWSRLLYCGEAPRCRRPLFDDPIAFLAPSIWAAAGAAIVRAPARDRASARARGIHRRVRAPPKPAAAMAPEPEPPEEIEPPDHVLGRRAARHRGPRALCLAPWSTGRRRGASSGLDARHAAWTSRRAASRNEPIAAVAMVRPTAIEKMPPIDPEQLVEELAQQEKQQPAAADPAAPAGAAATAAAAAASSAARAAAEDAGDRDGEAQRREGARQRAVPRRVQHARREADRGARRGATSRWSPRASPRSWRPRTSRRTIPRSRRRPEEDKLPGTERPRARRAGQAVDAHARRADAEPGGAAGGAHGAARTGARASRSSPMASCRAPAMHAIEQQRRDPGEKTKGQNGGRRRTPRVPDLKPTQEVLERVAGRRLGRSPRGGGRTATRPRSRPSGGSTRASSTGSSAQVGA